MTALLLAAALAIDLVLGEPPNALHPVVWMGRLIGFLERHAPRWELLYGAFIALAVPSLFAAGAWTLRFLPPVAYFVLAAPLLKSTFALRGLGRAARAVRDAVAAEKLDAARAALRSLCSRDAHTLDTPLVVAATVESVAENASDSFVAPLFYYALFGLPGAMAYRAINTADSMIGYHGRYERLGKAAARLDDLANFVPARLTALLLLLAGALARLRVRDGWRIFRRDGGVTESPNAGRPMAAMAGLLGVQLEKVGHYRLGDAGAALDVTHIDRAWRAVAIAAALAAACVMVARAV
jgi:adenosylcobinamide-phosphate synthase